MHKLLRILWKIQAWFGKPEPEEFKLFVLSPRISALEFRKRLIPLCYQENLFSITYRGQIFTARKLDPDGIHQYHLRCYENGQVTGHREMDYYTHTKEHNQGVDLRILTKDEVKEIKEGAVGVVGMRPERRKSK